jgi:hypothetical protein
VKDAQGSLMECYKHEARLVAQGSGNYIEAGKDIIFTVSGELVPQVEKEIFPGNFDCKGVKKQ